MAIKLYVGNLPYTTTDAELNAGFAGFGTVVSAQVVTDRYSGQSRGFGFVEMETQEEANAAIEGTNGKEMFGNRALVVNEARPREDRPANRGGGRGGYNRDGGDRGGYNRGGDRE